jgi:hypothetical protein
VGVAKYNGGKKDRGEILSTTVHDIEYFFAVTL